MSAVYGELHRRLRYSYHTVSSSMCKYVYIHPLLLHTHDLSRYLHLYSRKGKSIVVQITPYEL